MAENRIAYDIYRESDAEEMARLLAATFVTQDPPAMAAGLTASDFEDLVRLLCKDQAMENLTIIARAADSGEMAGALLAQDSSTALPPEIDRLSTRFDPIFDILGHLEKAYRGGRTVPPGESLHLFLLGVAKGFGGQGIGRQLVSRCTANGARRGYRLAVTEATNLTSQHIFRTEGFVERVRESYEKHRYEGRAVFASIAAHGGPILMDKVLTP